MAEYDVIIVGAGPAGLTLAHPLSEAGLRVLVLERKPQIGLRPIRCGEAFGPASDWPKALPFDPAWIESKIAAVIVESSLGTRHTLWRHGLGWTIDRSRFEQWLCARAEKAGAKIQCNAYAQKACFQKSLWRISWASNGKAEEAFARILVGADGVESRVGSWTGIRPKNPPDAICTTAQVHLPLSEYKGDELYFFVGPRYIEHGYAWIFPGVGGKRNVGVGTLVDRRREPMDLLLKNFLVQKNISLPHDATVTYGAVPLGGFDGKVFGVQSLLVGDAASMVYPLSAAGIFNALSGALMASECIRNFFSGRADALREYPKKFKKAFQWYFLREMWGRRLIFSCSDEELDHLFSSTAKAMRKDPGEVSEARAVLGLLRAGVPFVLKKLFRHAFACLFLFLLVFGSVHAKPSQEQVSELQRALNLGEQQRYDSCFAAFDSLIQRNPSEPTAWVLRMSMLGMKMMDYESSQDQDEFVQGLEKAIQLSDAMIAKDSDAAWVCYTKAAAMAALASQHFRQNHYWTGTRTGMKALNLFEEALQMDSTLYDCLLYLGLYDYVKGELQAKLKWILFWKKAEGKIRGIKKIEQARAHSLFSRNAAAQTLVGIYAREGNFAKAQKLFAEIQAELPENRSARWTLANAFYEREKWSEAADLYAGLSPFLADVPGLAKWQWVLCKYREAQCLYKMGKARACESVCREALKKADRSDRRCSEIQKDIETLQKKLPYPSGEKSL